jgi:hypothetical protein
MQILWPNAKVSDGSQPPMTFDLSLRESAGSRSLDRLVMQGTRPNVKTRFHNVNADRFERRSAPNGTRPVPRLTPNTIRTLQLLRLILSPTVVLTRNTSKLQRRKCRLNAHNGSKLSHSRRKNNGPNVVCGSRKPESWRLLAPAIC